MSKRKRKPKRKNSDRAYLSEQIEGCFYTLYRVIALLIMLFSILVMGVLLYLQAIVPGVDMVVWIVISALSAYLSGYFAFESEDDEEKRKNDWYDEGQRPTRKRGGLEKARADQPEPKAPLGTNR